MENQERNRENEQNQENILEVLKEAIEKGKMVEISQTRGNGEIITNLAFPMALEGNYLTVDADGYGFDIEISSISDAKIIEENAG